MEYKGVRLDCGYHVDLLVEDKLIIELKSSDSFVLFVSFVVKQFCASTGVLVPDPFSLLFRVGSDF